MVTARIGGKEQTIRSPKLNRRMEETEKKAKELNTRPVKLWRLAELTHTNSKKWSTGTTKNQNG
jgi:hypothetical protein